MFRVRKYRPRRAEIRKNRPDLAPVWQTITRPQILTSLGIALGFWVTVVAITTLRERMVRYRVGDFAQEDILSRVEFRYFDVEREADLKKEARELAPRVYRANPTAF